MIYVRFQLAGFKQGAPKKLLLIPVIGVVIGVGGILVLCVFTGSFQILKMMAGQLFGGLISAVIFYTINKIYYGKRAEMFTN